MPSRIGTLAEKSLHAALKDWYARPGDQLESRVEGFFIDILRPAPDPDTRPHCIEIQTRHLGAMKPKLSTLLDRYSVHVVHPIATEHYIIRIDADGVVHSRRKSPKRGTLYHLFPELVSLPALLGHPNLTLEVALIRDEEVWVDDGKGSWRRKRWSIHDRRLLEIGSTHMLTTLSDYAALIPSTLPDSFDSQELAKAIGQPRPLAQKMAYCLREMGILQIAEKRGRAYLYRLNRAGT